MPEVGKCPMCPDGARDVALIGGLCNGHWRGEKVERSERIVALKEIAKVPIKKVSDRKAEEIKVYKTARKAFLKEKPNCEAKLQGCTGKATEVHHPEGRIGDKLLELHNCKALCHRCHRIVETSPNLAKEKGLSKSRLKKEK